MTQNYVCPNCSASNTRFRATLGSHICQRCGHEWAPTQVGKRNNPLKRVLKWIAWASTALAVIYIFVGVWGAVAFFGIPAIAAWALVFKMSQKDNELQTGQPSIPGNELTVARNRVAVTYFLAMMKNFASHVELQKHSL